MNNKCDGCKFYCNGRCFAEKDSPYVEYADCQGENNRHDTISNQETIRILKWMLDNVDEDGRIDVGSWYCGIDKDFKEALSVAIKSVEKRPKGRWKEATNGRGRSYFCSRCGTQYEKPYDDCPNCGVDMRGDV